MNGILSTLSLYFSYEFVRYALIVGVLIALCSSLFGVILVLKRFSFIGDGLSHVAFGAMAVAAVLNLTDNLLLVMPVTVICAILLLKTGQHTRLKGDAAIAVVSVGALAVGYLVMDVFSTSPNVAGDVCSTLFGSSSILTLSLTDVWVCVLLSLVVIALFILFYHKIFLVTFDEDFARAVGVRASVYNLFIAVITAVIIVLAMNLVGSLLISALIVFPALSAMRICRSFRATVICSAALGVTGAILGILISLLASTPVGPTIVVMELAIFLIAGLFGTKR
jgi:zinc transport system permease protein